MSGQANGSILVTFGALEQGANSTRNVAGQIQQELNDLRGYLAPLVATWTGTASDDYQALQRKWDTAADDLHKALQQIAQAITVACENYTQTERANASMWR
jgi:early secretory antigenic target protein ESAT-6